MKKLLLFLFMMCSGFFSCQKENTLLKSDETISIELAHDQDFKDYFKAFEAMLLKIKDVDPEMLEKLKSAEGQNEINLNQHFHTLGIEIELSLVVEKIKNLKSKYGENFNKTIIMMATKNSDEKLIDVNNFLERGRKERNNLRAALPCTTVLEIELVAIGGIYAGAAAGCVVTTVAYGACLAGATATAILATKAAYALWDNCMADIYGHY